MRERDTTMTQQTSSKEAAAITGRAMLCAVNISQWTARKHDKKVSDEVAQQHGATSSDVGHYNKTLIAREALGKINKIAADARNAHYFATLPWSNDGFRILPSAIYLEHARKMSELRTQFEEAVAQFAGEYKQYVADARVRLNGLFNPDDYPAPSKIRRKFSFQVKVLPLPDADDFRVALSNDERDRIRRQITEDMQAAMAEATMDLWKRLHEAVSHMAERLQAYAVDEQTGKVMHPFRDTLVTNLIELVDVLPKLNVAGDTELQRLTNDVRDRLLRVPAQTLRDSASERQATAQAADQIMKQMSEYMSGYGA